MRKGFTIIELLVYISIFTLSMVAFITILVVVTRVQSRQSSQAEVDQQSQFLLQQLQYYVEASSLVDIPQDTPTTTLRLRMGTSAIDPIIISVNAGTVYLQQGNAAQAPLTSSKVTVSGLTFTKRSNGGGAHDSVAMSFTIAYNTVNVQRAFSQLFQTSVARVSAANFDSSLIPSSTNQYTLGASGQQWSAINGLIFFNSGGGGVGIGGSPDASAKLQVHGGDVYVDQNTYGLVLRDSGGVCWRVNVLTDGTLNTASTTCP